MRLRLDLAYDGTDFAGWARQPGQRTIQEVLETWITQVLRLDESVTLIVAGRTDAGVHATAQVAHFDLPDDLVVAERHTSSPLPRTIEEIVMHRLGRVLPKDIVVHHVTRAPEGFDARFSALWRRYTYRIWDEESQPDPVLRRRVATVRDRVDLNAFNAASEVLLGLRDFAPFCRPRAGATTIRTLLDMQAMRTDDSSQTIEVSLRADAFCHSMVRSLVGAVTAVAIGQRNMAWLEEVMAASSRHSNINVMPAAGLTLSEVLYPPDDELAARAELSRTMRTRDEIAGDQ